MRLRSTDRGIAALLDDLQGLGFSDYEARAYVALLQMPPATAYEVSKTADLPKSNAYAVLESLHRKQAVQPVSEAPVRYMAVAPEILFGSIAASTEQRCARITTQLKSLAPSRERDYVWSITGAEAIDAKIRDMILSAKDHVWIKASEGRLEPHVEALRQVVAQGVEVLIILFGENPVRFDFGGRTRVYLHEGNGVPVGIAPHLITITRDFEEALVADLRGEAHGSYTRNKPVVTMADTLIRHEIYFAEIFERLGPEIQEIFGPALIELRRKYLPKDQAAALERLLSRRKSQGGSTERKGRKQQRKPSAA
jgi:sugar-specific transcriptional regulator TrmB